jgi:hypothetical protein
MTGSALPTLNAIAAWDAMSPADQAKVGRAALVLACSMVGMDFDRDNPARTPLSVACETAYDEAARALIDLYGGQMARWRPRARFACSRPDLNDIGIRSCEVCGCTEDHACPGRCWWVGPKLCSTCAARGSKP